MAAFAGAKGSNQTDVTTLDGEGRGNAGRRPVTQAIAHTGWGSRALTRAARIESGDSMPSVRLRTDFFGDVPYVSRRLDDG